MHAQIQEFLTGGGGGGGGGGGVQAQLPENSSDKVFFSPQHILQFYSGLSMVYLKKTVIFQGFRGGPTFSKGGPTFCRGAQLFPGGGV